MAILWACKIVRSSTKLTGFEAGGERVWRARNGFCGWRMDCLSFFEIIAGDIAGGCCNGLALGDEMALSSTFTLGATARLNMSASCRSEWWLLSDSGLKGVAGRGLHRACIKSVAA